MDPTPPSTTLRVRFSLARLMWAVAAFGLAAAVGFVWEIQTELRLALALLAVAAGVMVLVNRVQMTGIIAAVLLALFGAIASMAWRGQQVQAQADEIRLVGGCKVGFKYETLLEWFGPPTSIEFVSFEGSGNDHSLQSLKGVPEVEFLLLRGSQYTDAALVHLQHAGGLRLLTLEDTSVTGDGLQHLASLPALRELHVSYARIADDAVPQLVQLKGLTHLWVRGTQITPAGLRALQQALPRCDVRD